MGLIGTCCSMFWSRPLAPSLARRETRGSFSPGEEGGREGEGKRKEESERNSERAKKRMRECGRGRDGCGNGGGKLSHGYAIGRRDNVMKLVIGEEGAERERERARGNEGKRERAREPG